MEEEKHYDGILRGHLAGNFNLERVERARLATEAERSMKFGAVLRKYWKAAAWSVVLSTALVMEGFDVIIINSFWGNPAFLERFGQRDGDGHLYIPANWQAAINNAALIGEIVGLGMTGILQNRYGSRPTYLIGMFIMAVTIFAPVFATSLEILFAGEILMGLAWGMFQTLTTAYAAEICPIALRAYLASYVNMCWGIGLTLGAGVVRGTLNIEGQWSWRLPYALQWIWPLPLFVAVCFAPEGESMYIPNPLLSYVCSTGPWWLVKNGKIEEARRSLWRLAAEGSWTDEGLDDYIALIEYTNELEREEVAGSGFADCFRKSNRRRTEIACMVWTIQYSCGQPIVNYTTQFLQTAGMNADQAFDINLGNNAMIVFGTLVTWVTMIYIGRRPLYIAGCAGMAIVLGITGIMGCIKQTTNVTWAIGVLLLLLTLVFACTVGPACYTIVAELPSSRVRQQTIILARGCYLVAGVIVQQLNPRMLGVADWNWGAKAGFFYLGTNALGCAYCYFRLPETKGRTFGELDVLFSNNVSARKFRSTPVSAFEDTTAVQHSIVDQKAEETRIELAVGV
ncbi:trehalose transport-related protein [Kockovaella imperatae]|uniref:Trehalose transport-related protein n=1 Tax=Kockovaella imperatae TaxID=4999 RepID=A0A1Y1USM4_9TREE|nr:trehalose transport-related protein [Kockovaella imperatae]ORX40205.1 trehalose transport-related protein [Kockovaella imperatae]